MSRQRFLPLAALALSVRAGVAATPAGRVADGNGPIPPNTTARVDSGNREAEARSGRAVRSNTPLGSMEGTRETMPKIANGLGEAVDDRAVRRADVRTTALCHPGVDDIVLGHTLRQRILAGIADPNIAFLLLILGVLAIYVEFIQPGRFVPGVVGSTLALLGLSALSALPMHWPGAALMVLALALLLLEARFRVRGILGAGGAAALTLGARLLIRAPNPERQIHGMTALALAVPFSAITVFLVSLAWRARAAKRHSAVEHGTVKRVGG